jgi:hypothetical protein
VKRPGRTRLLAKKIIEIEEIENKSEKSKKTQ